MVTSSATRVVWITLAHLIPELYSTVTCAVYEMPTR